MGYACVGCNKWMDMAQLWRLWRIAVRGFLRDFLGLSARFGNLSILEDSVQPYWWRTRYIKRAVKEDRIMITKQPQW